MILCPDFFISQTPLILVFSAALNFTGLKSAKEFASEGAKMPHNESELHPSPEAGPSWSPTSWTSEGQFRSLDLSKNLAVPQVWRLRYTQKDTRRGGRRVDHLKHFERASV
jgi:hypothetical protein